MDPGSTSTCFAFLIDNIPNWITRLDDLSAQISSRQAELSLLAETNATSSADHKDSNGVKHLRNLHDENQRRRKRKTASISSAASGTQRYRSRSMIIVYYDSAVQETFEALVRGIGSARNNVRKAKMNRRMKSWAPLAGSDEDSEILRARYLIPRTTVRNVGEKTIYDTVDTALETAQGMCETGAHQFLRDGDCRKEIEAAKKNLGEVQVVAAEELKKAKEEEVSKNEEVEIRQTSSPGDEGIEVDDNEDDGQYPISLDWKRSYSRA